MSVFAFSIRHRQQSDNKCDQRRRHAVSTKRTNNIINIVFSIAINKFAVATKALEKSCLFKYFLIENTEFTHNDEIHTYMFAQTLQQILVSPSHESSVKTALTARNLNICSYHSKQSSLRNFMQNTLNTLVYIYIVIMYLLYHSIYANSISTVFRLISANWQPTQTAINGPVKIVILCFAFA